jgi:methylated-DNA-[protein]-cysteine S-methyltransferase
MYTRHAISATEQIDDVIIVASDAAVVGIYFPQHWTKPDVTQFGDRVDLESDPVLAVAARQLDEYLAGQRTVFDFLTESHGNDFQERVWALLAEIPFGETTTYGEIAEKLGDRSLARMVGQAVGHNPLSIVVGCHRVVGKDGKLTGYAGGLKRKEFLLNLEEPESVKATKLF